MVAMSRDTQVEVSFRGKWSSAPALAVEDRFVVVNGRWVKIATIHDEQWLTGELQDPGACVELLKRESIGGVKADIFTFAQKLPATTPKYPYPMEWDSVAAVKLPGYEQWWTSLPQVARKNSRRAARRGVVISVKDGLDDRLIRDIAELNNESPMRQGTPFHHYGKSYEQVKKDQSTHLGRCEFICAYLGEELIGFLKIVYCGDFGTLLLLITKPSRQDDRPANALIAKAIERCDQKGLSYMVYGKFRYGNQPRTSLMEFKERNGFSEILVPRYYVPLTIKGAAAMKLRLHRDAVGILPEGAIAIGRRLRSEWYKLKQSTSAINHDRSAGTTVER
jgi:hypothetical protein